MAVSVQSFEHRRPFKPLPQLSHSEALLASRSLRASIGSRADASESDRCIAAANIHELAESGLFAVMTPKRFGGSGLGFRTVVEVAMTAAEGCGSTGWVYGVLAGHNWLAALFSERAQEEVFDNPRSLVASVFRLSGKVVREGEGYRMRDAEGRFCSGVDFAHWVIVGCAIEHEGSAKEAALFLVSKSEVEVIDDWFTAGMRGTGSRSIRIADSFIPAHRMIRMSDVQKGTTPGAQLHEQALFRVPFGVGLPFTLIGAPLGMANAAATSFAEGLNKRLTAQNSEQLGEQSATFARLSQASATIDSACELVLADAYRIDTLADPVAMTFLERAKVKRDVAHAVQTCRYAVTSLFEASGGSGIYEGSSLQRNWRDINSAGAHVAFGWDTAAAAYGRARSRLPPSKYTSP